MLSHGIASNPQFTRVGSQQRDQILILYISVSFLFVGCVVPDFHSKSFSNQCFLSSIPSTDQTSSVGVARTQLPPPPSYCLSLQNLYTINITHRTHVYTSAESRHASQHVLFMHTIILTNFNTFYIRSTKPRYHGTLTPRSPRRFNIYISSSSTCIRGSRSPSRKGNASATT